MLVQCGHLERRENDRDDEYVVYTQGKFDQVPRNILQNGIVRGKPRGVLDEPTGEQPMDCPAETERNGNPYGRPDTRLLGFDHMVVLVKDPEVQGCLLYTSDAADDLLCVD